METLTINLLLADLGRNSLQAALLVPLVLLAQWTFRNQLSPRWRCALWLVVVGRLLVPFSWGSTASLSPFFPAWAKWPAPQPVAVQPPVSPPAVDQAVSAKAPESMSALASSEPQFVPPPPSAADVPAQAMISTAPDLTVPDTAINASAARVLAPAPSTSWSWTACLFWVWLAGVVVLLGHVLISSLRLTRRCAKLPTVVEPKLLAVLETCCAQLQVKSAPTLLECSELGTPALHGFFRPRLLLPKGFALKFSADDLRFVFLHELAHLKRHDLLMNWVVVVLQTAHWFNPLVWLAFARWRDDRELACDAMALEAAGPAQNRGYGQTMLRLLENFTHPLHAPGLVGILENKRQLRRRIGMIATYTPAPRRSVPAICLLGLLAVISLADARDDQRSSTATKTPSSLPADASQADDIRLTVDLHDGSRVTGTSLQDTFRFQSPLLGGFSLAAQSVRSVVFNGTNAATLTLANGDVMKVRFAEPGLLLKTSFGRVELAADSVRKVSVAAGGHSLSMMGVLAGPILNPANGHSYYLLETNTWTGAESLAVSLGGHLTTINNAQEAKWISKTFATFDDSSRNLWIGLYRPSPKEYGWDYRSDFVWVSGEPVTYTHWSPGEPNNYNNQECFVAIIGPPDARASEWNDADNLNSHNASGEVLAPTFGVVEVASPK